MKWKIRKVRMFEALGCAAWCLSGVAVSLASDQPTNADHEAWEVQSVRELMQLDIERSLEQARERNNASVGMVDTSGGRLVPRLVAMYGVGRNLMAEVLVGPQAYLYMRGQAYPIGYVNDQAVYQLRGMNGSCIQLQKAQSSHSLCLHAMLGTRQP